MQVTLSQGCCAGCGRPAGASSPSSPAGVWVVLRNHESIDGPEPDVYADHAEEAARTSAAAFDVPRGLVTWQAVMTEPLLPEDDR